MLSVVSPNFMQTKGSSRFNVSQESSQSVNQNSTRPEDINGC